MMSLAGPAREVPEVTVGGHFERVAVVYESLRTTDEAPVRAIGQLFIYTRTPQQNARTIWGRYFPGFTEHEQRLHSQAAIRDAVRRTGRLQVVATQTFQHPRSSTAGRLRAQAEGRHYSTFSLYTPAELRVAVATFLARLPSAEVCWVDEHLLVVAGRSRNQVEPDGPRSGASQAI